MDYLPPGYIVKVSNRRWRRWVIKDGLGQFLAAENRWTDNPSKAVLFCRELDAVKTKNRHCLGDTADTFTATVVVAVRPGRWSRGNLPVSWHATGSSVEEGRPARRVCCWKSSPTR